VTTLKLGTLSVLGAALSLGMATLSARAELSAEELAKIAQHPVGAMISVHFQNNTNFNVGPESGTQNVLNIQPVIPVTINNEWNLITRTIMPLVWQPGLTTGQGTTFGLGGYCNAVHSDGGANWQLRLQAKFLFPK